MVRGTNPQSRHLLLKLIGQKQELASCESPDIKLAEVLKLTIHLLLTDAGPPLDTEDEDGGPETWVIRTREVLRGVKRRKRLRMVLTNTRPGTKMLDATQGARGCGTGRQSRGLGMWVAAPHVGGASSCPGCSTADPVPADECRRQLMAQGLGSPPPRGRPRWLWPGPGRCSCWGTEAAKGSTIALFIKDLDRKHSNMAEEGSEAGLQQRLGGRGSEEFSRNTREGGGGT